MVDINKHPLIRQAYELSHAIEECGAGEKQTAAVVKASALMSAIFEYVVAPVSPEPLWAEKGTAYIPGEAGIVGAKPAISHDQAAESALRFINAFFDNPGRTKPQIRIPRDPTDDDAILMAYINQQRAAQSLPSPAPQPSAYELAKRFHETYERLAPEFGYKTREESAKPWESVPVVNQQLMTAVCAEIMAASPAQPVGSPDELAETLRKTVYEFWKLGKKPDFGQASSQALLRDRIAEVLRAGQPVGSGDKGKK